MAKHSTRITLSVGDDGYGPRTVGEINAFGLSFALYQAWMYMAVFGAAKTFRESAFLPGFTTELQPLLIYAFLIASALCLFLIAFAERRLANVLPRRRTASIASCMSVVGTVLVFIGSPLGITGVLVGGILMGFGASVFLVRWGNAFARFDFATSVINSAIAFALGFVMAIAFTNWIPSPFTGILAILMPVLMTIAFWNRKTVPPTSSPESIESRYLRRYLVLFVACLVFFGFVMGALRAICGTQLLAFSRIAIELVLGLGCFVSVLVLLTAMIATKKETSWDSLFRMLSPIIVIGIVSLTSLLGDFAILGCFFIALGYVCLEALLWIFLANMAKSMSGSSAFVIGLGYGVMQASSIAGVIVENAFVHDINVVGPLTTTPEMSNLALVLITAIAFGYAILPRYREFKAALASMIKELAVANEWSVSSESLATTETDESTVEETAVSTSTESITEISEISETSEADSEPSDDEPVYAPTSPSSDGHYAITSTGNEDMLDISEYTSALPQEKGSFMRRCDEIVSMYLLSEREREVLILLAKGHNAAFIQDKLCISRSTAKTHINHIYKKLDIHTHQELLNMVEDRPRGPRVTS